MPRRFGLVYSLFSVVVLLSLTGLVLGRLNTVRAQNLQEVESSYRRLVSDLDQTDSVDAIRSQLREYAAIVPAIEALVLFHPDQGLSYVWTAETDLLRVPNGDFSAFRGLPQYALSDISQVRLRDDLPESGGLYLDGVYTVLSFSDAYVPLRDSLIALLVFAFVTVLIVLYLGRDRRAVRSRPHETESDAHTREAERSAAPSRHERSPAPEPQSQSTAAAHAPAPETHEPVRPEAVEEIALEEVAVDGGEPGSLVNAATGLSYRDHLERRLGLELERSAYNDQDLACVLIRFRSVSGHETYVQAASIVLSAFQYEDLCFEYDENSFVVILPNTELPQAIKQAEAFRRRNPDVIMGLSARNGRLVEPGRVLAETVRSLAHAENEPGGIVGFRPDPRKYRQFVTQHFGGRD